MKKNYGLNLKKEETDVSYKDWVFGASSLKCLAEIPVSERSKHLPVGELQNIGEEKMDCASRSPLNILECKFNWLISHDKISRKNINWLADNGYLAETGAELSDAFVAINSGTTLDGNSLKAPLEAIRTKGLIPKMLLPQGNTFEEHHDPERITPAMVKLGKEFIKRFKINYEKVYEENYDMLIKNDLLDVAGYAWTNPLNGEYPRTDREPNHSFVIYKPKYFAFYNYIEPQDGDFIKKLAPDFNFVDYGYRIFISAENPSLGFFDRLLGFLKDIWKEIWA